jgi:hypothetical protein
MPGLAINKLKKQANPVRVLNNILKSGSPLMERAQTIGLQTANKLGQFNTSMAAGHATNAMLDSAVPLAVARSQNATTLLGKKWDIRSTARENTKDRDFTHSENRIQRGFDRGQKQADRDLQTQIAQWNLDSADRSQVSTLVTQFANIYESSLASIMSNKNLKSEDRAAQIKGLKINRANFLDFLGQTYDVDIEWPSARGK